MIEARPLKQRGRRKILLLCLMALGGGAGLPLVSLAQPQQSSPLGSLSERQKMGRRLFMQNCSFCHLARNENPKNAAGATALGGDLKGLFKEQSAAQQEAVRTLIERGIPKKMPGFQYGLKPAEIETIIQYLKTL